MKTGGTLYSTATVTVRQFHLNPNVWAVTWKAGDEWAEIKDRLKELLWAFEYKYDANSKSWLISKSYGQQLQNVLLSMFKLDNINWPGNEHIAQLQAEAQAEQREKDRRREREEWGRYNDQWRREQQRKQEEQSRRQRTYSTPNSTQTDPYSVLMVTRSAPLGLCEAAYRYWAKELHPDAGGSHDKMKAINAAIQEIRRIKGK